MVQVLDLWESAQLLDSKLLTPVLARAKQRQEEMAAAKQAAEAAKAAQAASERAARKREQASLGQAGARRERSPADPPPRKMQKFTMGVSREQGGMQRFATELHDQFGSAGRYAAVSHWSVGGRHRVVQADTEIGHDASVAMGLT